MHGSDGLVVTKPSGGRSPREDRLVTRDGSGSGPEVADALDLKVSTAARNDPRLR
ncbi:hypothetical protein ACLKM7_17270 [Microbacterium sp. I2]|uniref:hypothetical protein n=1 Tax=Microbacterium sp. I2 TaxID=3391826 RepID=UPI003ED84C58